MLASRYLLLIILLFRSRLFFAQTLILTTEDSLDKNLTKSTTTIGGYGNAFFQRNSNTNF